MYYFILGYVISSTIAFEFLPFRSSKFLRFKRTRTKFTLNTRFPSGGKKKAKYDSVLYSWRKCKPRSVVSVRIKKQGVMEVVVASKYDRSTSILGLVYGRASRNHRVHRISGDGKGKFHFVWRRFLFPSRCPFFTEIICEPLYTQRSLLVKAEYRAACNLCLSLVLHTRTCSPIYTHLKNLCAVLRQDFNIIDE